MHLLDKMSLEIIDPLLVIDSVPNNCPIKKDFFFKSPKKFKFSKDFTWENSACDKPA
jgi:hypothetical protein